MQKQIENLINKAIDDFNSKWKSHEERNTGVSEYAEKIVNFINLKNLKKCEGKV